MFKKALRSIAVALVVFSTAGMAAANKPTDNYAFHPKAKLFVDKMVEKHGLDRAYVEQLMASAVRKQSILDAIARPAERTKTWAQYRKIFVTDTRTEQGLEFMKTYAKTLEKAERDFGVPAEIIAAIIGVETRYGKHKGRYRVLDALTTLGFDYPPRSQFFSKELEEYLLLVSEQNFDANEIKGSYAGAMGYGQFIPSSYRYYAIDFDGDGIADIVNNPIDAIGSVANYFKSHGWKPGEAVTLPAKTQSGFKRETAKQKLKPKWTVEELKAKGFEAIELVDAEKMATAMLLQGDSGEEYWLGLKNFYVITRYNHSRLYAMAVYQLSEQLKSGS